MNNSIFRNIMVATDGSELVRKAVDTAIEIAKLSEAKLYAVYVIALGSYYNSITHSRDAEWIKAIKEQFITEGKEATAYVENAGRDANVEVESVILEGSPADEIIDFAEKNEIDLIVIGTKEKNGMEATAYVENAGRIANVAVKSVIHEGNPADEIIDFAEKNEIDLIVMGTQGKTVIQSFLIGSVAENVVRHSKVPVLVVRG